MCVNPKRESIAALTLHFRRQKLLSPARRIEYRQIRPPRIRFSAPQRGDVDRRTHEIE
jgi:hypothetical protein